MAPSGRALLGLLALAAGVSAQKKRCNTAFFTENAPDVFGLEVTGVTAELVTDWNDWKNVIPATPGLPVEPKEISFCDVKVFYTHPGLNDSIRVDVWLPLNWNHRFLGQGGLGWAAGNNGPLAAGVAMGFAVAQTDTGHTFDGPPERVALDSSWWGVTSPGNVNLNALQNNGYRCLDDLAHIAKHIIKVYYKKDIKYSYWNGCSTGGRQGLELAQRYPKHFNGILAAAPSQNWATFLITEHWAHVKMKELNYYPSACELQAITSAAILACDDLDGITDNVIASRECPYNPRSVIGQSFKCKDGSGTSITVTEQAVKIAQAVWSGPEKDGKPIWHGLSREASLYGLDPVYGGLARTDCKANNTNCKSAPFAISSDYIRNWVIKDTNFDLTNVDEDMFFDLLRTSKQQYHSFLDANDPDLEPFQKAGGKIIHWHGLADQLIPPNGSLNYYLRVKEQMGDIDDFYRYFEAPGVAHCFGGDGAFPLTAIVSLIEWVERGTKPKSIEAVSVPELSSNPKAPVFKRPICPYPKVPKYLGPNPLDATSYVCARDFGRKKAGMYVKKAKVEKGRMKVPVMENIRDKIEEWREQGILNEGGNDGGGEEEEEAPESDAATEQVDLTADDDDGVKEEL